MVDTKEHSGIVCLASYPRSGNTWTRNFLANLFTVLEGSADQPADINRLDAFTLWDISADRFQTALGKPILEATRAEIAAARETVHRQIPAVRSRLSAASAWRGLSAIAEPPVRDIPRS